MDDNDTATPGHAVASITASLDCRGSRQDLGENSTMPDLDDSSSSAASGYTGQAYTASTGQTSKDSDRVDNNRPLVKSNSVLSHKSIPVIGEYPLGSLRVVRPADSILEDGGEDPDDDALNIRVHKRSELHETPACLLNADIFLAVGLGNHFQLGCDSVAMRVQKSDGSAALAGFRDLPPGAHFVWLSQPGAMFRYGYWFLTRHNAGTIRVKQWNPFTEVFGECASQYEVRSLAENIKTLYPNLVPYINASETFKPPPSVPPKGPARRPEDVGSSSDIWRSLTSCITEQLLSRVTGRKSSGGNTEWLIGTADTSRGEMVMKGKIKGAAEFVFLFSRNEVDPYRLLAINDRQSTGQDPTRPSTPPDVTQEIISLLENSPAGYTEDDIVGELQFLFLTGTLLSNVSCLEQWWHLVLKVILRARRLVACRPGLCRVLFKTLHTQFIYLERYVAGGFAGASSRTADEDGTSGIFDIKAHGEARLRAALIAYKRRLNDVLLGLGSSVTPEEAAAGQAFADLEAWLWKYGWDLRSDYIPGVEDHDANDEVDGNDDDEDESDEDTAENSRARRWPVTSPTSRVTADQYDSEDSEDQPVLVELDESGREVGLVSWD